MHEEHAPHVQDLAISRGMEGDLDDLPTCMTVKEAQAVLRVGRSTMYEAVRTGQVSSFKVMGAVRIPRREILRLMGCLRQSDAEASLGSRVGADGT